MIKSIFIGIFLLLACVAFAQDIEPIEMDAPIEFDTPIELEAVEVSAERQRQTGTEITSTDIEKTGAKTLEQVLSNVPGVLIENGGTTGESSFSIRGFDSSYIPVIVDGISMTSPFNGRGDAGSLLMGDMESVIVQKGYSSMLMGANSMGGAILLTMEKPKKNFEASIKDTLEFDSIFSRSSNNLVASIGTKQDLFYIKGTFQQDDIDHTRLPEDYKPMQGSVQPKGERLFSDRKDLKASVIAGVTPADGLDIWTTYVYQTSDRGLNSPEASSQYALWGWDDWERQSVSLHGEYIVGGWDIGALLFYDTYDNTMSTYATFLHIDRNRPEKITEYSEYALGGSLNAGYTINAQHTVRGALSFRQDDHWGYRNDLKSKDDVHAKENKVSVALEYEFQPVEKLRFIASGGFDSLMPDTYWSRANAFAEYMGVSSYQVEQAERWLLAAQAGVFYDITENHELRLTYAKKNQFPTMSDRYSTRFGDSMPNPNLKPEIADHIELGYKGTFFYSLLIDVALYHSKIDDKMATIRVPDPFNSSHAVNFTTNMDAVSFYGLELTSVLFVSQYLELGGNLSLSDYSVDSSVRNAKTVPYHPKFTANAYIDILPWEDYISIRPTIEYTGERWIDAYEVRSLEAYYLFHLYLAFNITDNFKIDMTVKNIEDKLYEDRQNYPQPGRTYSLAGTVKF